MRVDGFSLFEFIVYIALFSFIAVLFLGVISRTQFKFMKNLSEQEVLLRQALAIDLLRRDLMSASILNSDWDEHRGIFKKITLTKTGNPQSVCVCWCIGKAGLTRVQGQYNFDKHEWDSKMECLACRSINQINFMLEKSIREGISVGVWVIYRCVGSDQAGKIFVKFRNRVVI